MNIDTNIYMLLIKKQVSHSLKSPKKINKLMMQRSKVDFVLGPDILTSSILNT